MSSSVCHSPPPPHLTLWQCWSGKSLATIDVIIHPLKLTVYIESLFLSSLSMLIVTTGLLQVFDHSSTRREQYLQFHPERETPSNHRCPPRLNSGQMGIQFLCARCFRGNITATHHYWPTAVSAKFELLF